MIPVPLQRVQGFPGVVLGVAARHDRLVRLQNFDPLVVELLIGNQVVVITLRFEPGEEMAVGLEMTQTRVGAGAKGDVARAQGEEGTLVGGMTDAAAVTMEIVGGKTVLGVLGRVVRVGVPIVDAPFPRRAVVGVGHGCRKSCR